MEAEDEDLHICGKCRLEFNSLNSFVQHKSECKQRIRTPFSTTSSSSSPAVVTSAPLHATSSSAEEDAAAALVAAAALSDISAEGLVEEEVEMHMDSIVEQMAEETVETVEDEEEDDDLEEEDGEGGESLVAKVLGEEVRMTKPEVIFDD